MNPSQLNDAHSLTLEEVFTRLRSGTTGLTGEEAEARLALFGPNTLPEPPAPTVLQVFARQFLSPLIYILLVVGTISFFIGELTDALFIYGILILNAIIGTVQEYHSEKSAHALRRVAVTRALVRRQGEEYELDAASLVPGDIVLLEQGSKTPADIRLVDTRGLESDESLLTGESMPVSKAAGAALAADCPVGDRKNMAFAGTLITRGRATGVVTATGLNTELGKIARSMIATATAKTPLLLRMEHFTRLIAWFVGATATIIATILFYQGNPFTYVLMFGVGLGVSAIPEGLPVALTIALAIASRRMAGRHVIVRKLAAVEALGSCTCICTDKTGTLTVNELTATRMAFPLEPPWEVTGTGILPEGELIAPPGVILGEWGRLIEPLCQAAVLCNDGFLGKREDQWVARGDRVDTALLVMAHKMGITHASLLGTLGKVADIPFEPERQFAATCHANGEKLIVSAKGAVERILTMCDAMATPQGPVPLDAAAVERQSHELAGEGFRVIALASRTGERAAPHPAFNEEHLAGLTFLGFVGMIDPLRPEAKAAVNSSLNAGIRVVMVTGDHPLTALTIARELGVAEEMREVVTGKALRETTGEDEVDRLVAGAKVFARVEPQQKLQIVRSLIRQGHFVAVTGDGVNDAPALKAAHVGVAMGKDGTDVARETADLVITDDRFSSIVAGIEEGRVAYANIRKVIYLLISTGAAEIVLIGLSVAFGLPLPLTAIQLLWLNLVTNGIQDVALALEAAEGDELARPPRSPGEPVFNRKMIEQVALSALVMGFVAFFFFKGMTDAGLPHADAQNETLLLMVLFENFMIGNCRSETRSAFAISPLKNPLLLVGTVAAQLVHIAAMHSSWFGAVLKIQPVTLADWTVLLLLASSVLAAMEAYKLMKRRKGKTPAATPPASRPQQP